MPLAQDLTRVSAVDLARLLRRRDVSSEAVTQAHLDRIEELDARVRAFTEVFHRRAVTEARAADRARSRGVDLGPLMGLPMTFKECFDVAGLPTTLGLPSRLGTPARADAVMLALAREQGAIVLGRTNLSQLMFFAESRNAIFGQTSNPWSLRHTAGGSSGGEAAALAGGMSPLGVGSDIGGSIRGPCHFCGVAGLKPTLDRWSARGVATGLPGQEAVRAAVGPMARSARDVAFLVSAFDPRAMARRDARVPPLAVGGPAEIELRGRRVGVFASDGILAPSPALGRALDRAAAALGARGCWVERFSLPDATGAILAYFAALSSDGGATAARALGGDRIDVVLSSLMRLARLRPAFRRAAARAARFAGEELLATVVEAMGEKSVAEYWRVTHTLREARFEVLDAMDAGGFDLLLAPPHATPATLHGGSKDFALAGAFSMLWNLAQCPAGVVPVGRVRLGETERPCREGLLARRAAAVDRASLGLPVGVQIIARPFQEDLVLAAMIAVEDDVRGEDDFPTTPVELAS